MIQQTTDTLSPQATTVTTTPGSRFAISPIWIVPAVAVLVALGLAVNAILARGPEITIRFSSAEGLEANKTKIKYKDVAVGTVTDIALGDDRRSVTVKVAMDKQAAPLLAKDSRFWVVRPRVGAGGVSGLTTLLSGAYIGIDPGKSPGEGRSFDGLDSPPLVVSDMPGRQFHLAAEDLGSIDVGVPVYFRRVPVGRVVGYSMRSDGKRVDVRVFVDAPFDRFVTPNSRFWHASGIDVSMDSEGMKLDMQSLVSLAVGGVAFTNVGDAGIDEAAEAPAEMEFPLFTDRTAALRVPDTLVQKYVLVFDESVRGLTVGSIVDFRGLPVGEVARIYLDYRPGSAEAVMAVEINLYPERLAHWQYTKAAAPQNPAAIRQAIDGMVAKGLRAQMRMANLLTGQRYVALDFFAKPKSARVNWALAVPALPTQPGSMDSLQEQLQTLMETLQKTLEHTNRLVASVNDEIVPELKAVMGDARITLRRAEGVLASDSPTQLELRDTLRDVGRAAAAIRDLAELLERQPEALLTGKKENP
jgi:paraquat-inducible protein B